MGQLRHQAPVQLTPVMTRHARDRCAEMGISTKVAKLIHRTRDATYPGSVTKTGEQSYIAMSDHEPDYVIAYLPKDHGPDVILTVLFKTTELYERAGETYIMRSDQ